MNSGMARRQGSSVCSVDPLCLVPSRYSVILSQLTIYHVGFPATVKC